MVAGGLAAIRGFAVEAEHYGTRAASAALAEAEAEAHRLHSFVARKRATVTAATAARACGSGVRAAEDCASRRGACSGGGPPQRGATLAPGTETAPLQLFEPFIEPDSAFPDFEAIVAEEAHAPKQPRLARARARYRRAARLEPVRYVDVLNLAACHQLLGKPALALPLLAQAVQLAPEGPAARVNEVLCLAQLGDRHGALAAIRRTFAEAADMTDAQHAMLLRCKASLLRGNSGHQEDEQAHAGDEEASPQPESPKTVDQLRAELRALCSPREEAAPPPWGRLHAYADDPEAPKDLGSGTVWQPLLPDQLDVLRRNLGKHEPGSPERQECARLAYEAARLLPFLKRLPPEQAILVLSVAEFVEVEAEEYLFHQGDLADFLYVIASGSVRIEVFSPSCGCAVCVGTLDDGQLFGETAASEKGEARTRRASIVAQERACLIRLLPLDYRSLLGAPDSSLEATLRPEEAAKLRARPSVQRQAMPENIRRRLEVLKRWPYLADTGEYSLAILASNVPEVELRHGDEFVKVGQVLQGCFLLLEGACKVYMLPEDIEEDDEDAESSRLAGLLCWRELGGPPRPAVPNGSCLRIAGPGPRSAWGPSAARRPRTPRASAARRPCYAARSRPRGASHTGVPRVGQPWEETLRGEPMPEVLSTPTSEELCLGFLHAGQAFGLCAVTTAPGECPEAAGARVRIDSCTARLIVLQRSSLMHLPGGAADALLAALRAADDPARPCPDLIRQFRSRRRAWAAAKERVLRAQLTTTL